MCGFPRIRLKHALGVRGRIEVLVALLSLVVCWRWHWVCRRRGLFFSDVWSLCRAILIVLRVVASHCLRFAWGWWLVFGGLEPVPAERTATVLGLVEAPFGLADRRWWQLCSPLGPVGSEGGVVRGGRARDQLVSDDSCPGELELVDAGLRGHRTLIYRVWND